MGKFVTSGIRTAAKITKQWPGFDAISGKLQSFTTKAFDKCCRTVERDGFCFDALVNGDMWSNNIMFAFDAQNRPVDAILVDFQIGYWGPAVIDVSYSLFTSSDPSLRDNDWDLLIAHYHNELKSMLTRLKYTKSIPTLSEIHAQFLLKACSMAPIGLVATGIRQLENVADNTMGVYLKDTDENIQKQIEIMENPKCRENIKFLLDFCNRKGFLDVD